MKTLALLIITALFLSTCASGTFTRKAYVKRDRYGEAPVIDMRNMESFNQRNYEQKKPENENSNKESSE